MDKKQETIDSYNKTVKEYAENVLDLHPVKESNRFLSFLSDNAKILDLGCGSGRDAALFSDKGYEVVGIDLSPKMVEGAKFAAPSASFQIMDFENLDFPSDTFDGVWSHASLLHTSKNALMPIFSGISSILKKDGVFFCSFKKGSGEGLERDSRYGNTRKFWSYYDEDELRSMLGKHFEIVESYEEDPGTSYNTHPWIFFFCKNKKA